MGLSLRVGHSLKNVRGQLSKPCGQLVKDFGGEVRPPYRSKRQTWAVPNWSAKAYELEGRI